jgi:hypothetical protein
MRDPNSEFRQLAVEFRQLAGGGKDASPALRQHLVQLVEGDERRADDLVARERFCKPGRSEGFYWSMAISRLEAARRAE